MTSLPSLIQGASASASLAMVYNYYNSKTSSIRFPCSFSTNYNPPYFNVDSFYVTSFSLGVSLAATMGFGLDYMKTLYANTSVTLIGNTEMGKGNATKKYMS